MPPTPLPKPLIAQAGETKAAAALGKRSRSPAEVASKMQFQVEPWDCERTQVSNAVAEYGERIPGANITSARTLVFGCFNGTLPTPVGGKNGWEAKLRRALGERHQVITTRPGALPPWDLVVRTLGDETCSFPVLAVSPAYWAEVDTRPKEMGDMDHVLLVLDANKDRVVCFDCYMNRVGARGCSKAGLSRSVTPREAVVEVPVERFIKYWQATVPPRFLFYIKRSRSRTLPLSDFAPKRVRK
jgi:hypothetical protein